MQGRHCCPQNHLARTCCMRLGLDRVLGATPGTPSLAPTFPHAPAAPKAGGGFISGLPPRWRHAQNASRCGIIRPIWCTAFQCWNLSSSSAAGAGTGGCTIKRERSSPAGGKEPERLPDITRIELCSCQLRRVGRRTISNPRKPGRGAVNTRMPLTSSANPCETAGLTAAAWTDRRSSRIDGTRADDPLRCAGIVWRYDAAGRRRL